MKVSGYLASLAFLIIVFLITAAHAGEGIFIGLPKICPEAPMAASLSRGFYSGDSGYAVCADTVSPVREHASIGEHMSAMKEIMKGA